MITIKSVSCSEHAVLDPLITEAAEERFRLSGRPGHPTAEVLAKATAALVAEKDGEMAGICLIQIKGRVGEVHHLFVRPVFRRHNIGTELAREAIITIQYQGCRSAKALIWRGNIPAENLWKSLKFVFSGPPVPGSVWDVWTLPIR